MEIAISAGVGVLLGLGLLIWGLRERSARHKAERKADEANEYRHTSDQIAENNIQKVNSLKAELERITAQITVLRKRLRETRNRLVGCRDPQTVKDWLDSELGEEYL